MAHPRNAMVGVVLAGGLSRRMGGGDKGLLALGDKPMLAHVIARLRPQVGDVILNANGDPDRFQDFALPVVPDILDGAQGPLSGVLAGLKWTAQNKPGATHIVTASSDAPFLPNDLAERLWNACQQTGHPIALAASGGNNHPVIGLWPVNMADDLEDNLNNGVRKVVTWTEKHGFATVDFPLIDAAGEHIDPFFNANTPEELDAARRLLHTLSEQSHT